MAENSSLGRASAEKGLFLAATTLGAILVTYDG